MQIRTLDDYHQAYNKSIEDPSGFWGDIARNFQWRRPWESVLEGSFAGGDVQWFKGGRLNITENCLDRHLETRGDQVAILWEPNEPGEITRQFTYRQLHAEVCRMANVLKGLDIKKGDRICLYLPMIPELVVAVLACARIGAVHSVVFAGFSASSISDRIDDAQCSLVITSDGMVRGPKQQLVKPTVDEALARSQGSVQKVLVIRRTGQEVDMVSGRDFLYNDLAPTAPTNCPAVEMDAEDMLFILYTSGSTGKPKGVVHTCGGYMVYAGYSFLNVFQYQQEQVFFCTADIGWVTGHTYIAYGPLLNGGTALMFEGIPTYPDNERFWQIIEKHKVNIFYTAPTAIRSLMAGNCGVEKYAMPSLQVLGSVGEPINEEAWHWLHDKVGKGRCPVTDTWWQTETGGIMIASLAGVTESRPAHAGLPLPGILPVLLDQQGNEIEGEHAEGYLAIKRPWPSVIRTTYGDHERCRQTYFAPYPGYYFTGDGARRESGGLWRIIGRIDDVINVSGHRFGTAEIENAIDESEDVVESAVVGFPHYIKGQGIYAFVIPADASLPAAHIQESVRQAVARIIGRIALPDKVLVVRGLPKTRSGKIMRRILRNIAEGDISNLGDTSTLLDPGVVEEIVQAAGLK